MTTTEVGETVAKNLVAARVSLRMSQEDLARQSGLSRTTVVQIESGEADPRLSTLAKMANTVQVSPILLLVGAREMELIGKLVEPNSDGRSIYDRLKVGLGEDDCLALTSLLESGIPRNRKRAIKIGAKAAAGMASGAVTGAAIGSALLPGVGTAIGGALGYLLGKVGTSSRSD